MKMLSRKLHIIVTAVVLLSACSWLPYAFLHSDLNVWLRIAAGIVGVLAIVLIFERDMYLPFLADAAFPTSLLEPTGLPRASGDIVVSIDKLPPMAKIVYWAAETKDPRGIGTKNVKEAYGTYTNAGVVQANDTGIATIALRCPQAYTVTHFGLHDSEVPPHLHYRYELPGTKGMLSEVFTLEVLCTKNLHGRV